MSKYWPDGLELSDTQSPLDILRDAQRDWKDSSRGVLALILQEAETQSGYYMVVVHARHEASNRTASLFSVVSRRGQPYPARLQPKDAELPNFFRKSYKSESLSSSMSGMMRALSDEKWVENEWVADTPGEFREKLAEVFNLGNIKSEIMNLVASVTRGDEGAGMVKDIEGLALTGSRGPG